MSNIFFFIVSLVVFTVSCGSIVQAKLVSCSVYEKRYNIAKKQFEVNEDRYILSLGQKRISMDKLGSGKIQVSLKNRVVKALAISAIAQATQKAFWLECKERQKEPALSSSSEHSFTLEEQSEKSSRAR